MPTCAVQERAYASAIANC